MTLRINDRRDVLLLLLYSPGKSNSPNEPITGRTRLVKMMFLFLKEALDHFSRGTEISVDRFYAFFPWSFGPFSAQIYDDLTFFTLRGFVQSSSSDEEAIPESAAEFEKWVSESGTDDQQYEFGVYEEESFTLTQSGMDFSERLYKQLTPSQTQLLKEFKARLVEKPLRGILRYVYSEYPDFTDKLQIKDEVLG